MGMCEATSPHLVNPRSQKFFSDLSHKQTINSNNNDISEKIKLKVFINHININCKYDIKLYNIIGNQNYPLNDISKCSIIGNSKAILKTPILIRFYFEKEQPLLIEIIKTKNYTIQKYNIKTTLGCIMGSRHNTFQRKFSSSTNETIIIQADKLKQNEDVLDIKFEVKANNYINFTNKKDKVYYEVYSNNILYRSECFNAQGKFNPVKIPLHLFKNNIITILFIKNTKSLIKKYQLNINDFVKKKSFNVIINDISFEIISRSKITKNYTFVDYLKAGIEIGLTVAIDFTSSNGYPNDINSLHFIHGNQPNQYERAINACGNIVGYYDYDINYIHVLALVQI